ncbi:MAG: hypothetical protein WCO06_03555 [Candidatus Roizmanbacteria bacterium]
MIRTQVYIPDDLYKEAKLYANIGNTSISEFVRQGLEHSIKEAKKMVTKKQGGFASLAGKFAFGKKPTDVATNHDDIYDL